MKVRISVEQENEERFLGDVMKKYHFSENDKETMQKVYGSMKRYLSPYAVYRINNRMRGVPLIDSNPCAIVAMTLGEGVDRLQRYYEQENQLAESYMAECLANELLLYMYVEFNRCYARFHRRFVMRYVFVGEEIPLTGMTDLIDEIYGRTKTGDNQKETQEQRQDREIRANEYGVIFPSKSVVFFAILSDNPKQVCEGICMNCANAACENRLQEASQIQTISSQTKLQDETAAVYENLNYGYQRIFGKTNIGLRENDAE